MLPSSLTDRLLATLMGCQHRIGHLRWGWSLLLLGPLALTGILLGAIWGLTYQQLIREQEQAFRAAQRENDTLAHVVAANLEQVLERTFLYADRAALSLDGPGSRLVPGALLTGDRTYLRFAVYDAHGGLRFSSSLLQGSISFLEMLEGNALPRDGQLILGRPRNNGEEAWLLPVVLGLHSPGGRQGVLVMALDLGYFLRLYQGAGLGERRLGIARDDGTLLVAADDLAISLGEGGNVSRLLTIYREDSVPVDGRRQLLSFRHLERQALGVTVEQDGQNILAGLAESRRHQLAWAWGLTLTLIGAALGLTGLAARQRRLYRRIQSSEARNQELIRQLETEKGQAYLLASHDHLTGLPNRMLFNELSASHLSGARRGQHLHALMFLDLDRFKAINDSLGHHVGDLLLQTVAERLRGAVRDSDLVARQGGDEFVLLINDLSSAEDTAGIAGKIIASVAAPCRLGDHDVEVRPSIGIALIPRDGLDLQTLIARADTAMYAAKEAGRGTFRFFDPALNILSVGREGLRQEFARALQEGGLSLHYQALVALEDFRLQGLEALVRWPHPDYGLICPGDILALAAELDLGAALGAWVMHEACHQLSRWQSEGFSLVPVTLNLAPEQLDAADFPDALSHCLAHYGLSADLLALDIPASWIAGADASAVARLEGLAWQGVSLRADDFGSGRLGFQHLRSLPVGWLKIDAHCIGALHQASGNEGAGSFIITLAHVQNLKVLVVGVETAEQLVRIKAAGGDGVQGYHLQRPAPAEEITNLLSLGKVSP